MEPVPNNDVCRLCMSSEPVGIFTQGQTVRGMISSLCLVTVRENDNMPRKICIQCLKLLQQFKQFREKCLETDKILHKQNNIVYTSDPIKKELFDDFYTEGTIKIEPCNDFFQNADDFFQADINSASDNQYDSDQSEDWFEKYFEEVEPKSKKQNRDKQNVNHEENRLIVCHVCGHPVKREVINGHVRSHSTEKTFCCNICSRKFKMKSSLKKHMKIHTNVRVTCDICNKSLSSLNVLKHHLELVHSEDENVKCDICGKKFKNKLLMKCHKKRHVKRYKCQYCDSMFADNRSKREHERLHTGETPYECPSCPKAYAQLANMKSHFKHNHKEIVFSEVYKPKSRQNLTSAENLEVQ